MNKLVKTAERKGRGDQRCCKEDKNAHWGEKTEMEWETNSDRRERERERATRAKPIWRRRRICGMRADRGGEAGGVKVIEVEGQSNS